MFSLLRGERQALTNSLMVYIFSLFILFIVKPKWCFDEDQKFTKRCNTEMVELSNLKPDSANVDVADLLQADETRLKQIIENHHENTGSERAKMLLDNWDKVLPQFIKVMPTDYRKALESRLNKQAAA